jgi:rhodanese-related sulfurtransferase
MSKINDILERARQRAREHGLDYAGAVTPDEAFELLQHNQAARLIDVRSAAEWQFVGTVPGAANIEFKTYPGMAPNPHFLAQLTQQVDKECLALFLCRTGARSDAAASMAARAGYTEAFNILEGFEGDKNMHGHRGALNGWKGHKLPWTQG